MKNSFYIILIACTCFLACKKDLSTDAPTVDIALTNARATIGDTLVFKLGDTVNSTLVVMPIMLFSGEEHLVINMNLKPVHPHLERQPYRLQAQHNLEPKITHYRFCPPINCRLKIRQVL